MDNVTKVSNGDLKSFLENLQYGSNLVIYQSDTVRDSVLNNINVLNEVFGENLIEELPAKDNELVNGEYQEFIIPNVYNVVYAGRGIDIPILSDSDYNYKKTAVKALDTKSRISFTLHEGLRKSAGRIAFGMGIKFGQDDFGCYFDAHKKGVSISKMIQESYYNGNEKIEFDGRKCNVASIRCYASNLGAVVGHKLPVTISSGIITVRFKKQDEKEILTNRVEKLYSEVITQLGKETARSIFEGIIFDAEFEEGSVLTQEAKTQTTTFNPGSEDADDVQAVSEYGQIYIKDPNVDIDKQDDEDF